MRTICFWMILLGTVSCSISTIEKFVVGENFVTDQSGIVLIDSMTLETSTVRYDSIVTSQADKFLVGNYINNETGQLICQPFFQMVFSDDIDRTEFTYDSLVMILNYDGYYFGDTTQALTINVNQLEEILETNDDGYLYNTSKFQYSNDPLGSSRFYPKPGSGEAITIRLNDNLGQELARLIMSKSDTLDYDDFLEYFKGIVLTTDTCESSPVIAISKTSSDNGTGAPMFRLYYHIDPNPEDLQDLSIDFSFNSEGIWFNQIKANFSNSDLAGIIDDKNDLSSEITGNKTFIQAGNSLFTKIHIPHVDKLNNLGKTSAFISANLIMYPAEDTYDDYDMLPDTFHVYVIDRKNKVSSNLILPNEDNALAYKRVVMDTEISVYYEVDVSTFITDDLAVDVETDNSLLLGFTFNEASSKIDRLVFGGSKKQQPKLNIYYYHN